MMHKVALNYSLLTVKFKTPSFKVIKERKRPMTKLFQLTNKGIFLSVIELKEQRKLDPYKNYVGYSQDDLALEITSRKGGRLNSNDLNVLQNNLGGFLKGIKIEESLKDITRAWKQEHGKHKKKK
jgi:hypothetical protein